MTTVIQNDDELPYNNKNKIITEKQISYFLELGDIDINIGNVNLYRLAFVHKSYCTRKNENIINGNKNCPEDCIPLQEESNERLEFLGDSILNSATASYLFERYYNETEGFLTKMRTKLVNGKMLALMSKTIKLNNFLIISKQLEKIDARNYNDYAEDVFEAFIGAIFLDKGFDVAKNWVMNIFEEYVDFTELVRQNQNYKDQLIKYCQQNLHYKPQFIDITSQTNSPSFSYSKSSIEAPTNIESVKLEYSLEQSQFENNEEDKIYSGDEKTSPRLITITIKTNEDRIIGIGKGTTKKEAEQDASNKALIYYGVL